MITIRNAFPGICALISALAETIHAFCAYNKAANATKPRESRDPGNAWTWEVAHRSLLSYSEALEIYAFLIEDLNAYKYIPGGITKFVIQMANCGHTKDMIILYLQQIDMELDVWTRDMLSP